MSDTRNAQAVRDAFELIGRIIETGKAYARDEIPGGRKSPVGSGTEIALDHYKDAMRDGLAALDAFTAASPAPPPSDVVEIVAWLRSPAGNELASRDEPHLEIADMIEAGDYRPAKEKPDA